MLDNAFPPVRNAGTERGTPPAAALAEPARTAPVPSFEALLATFEAPGGTDMLSTFLVFLNVEAIRRVRAEIDVSPDAYSHVLIRRPGSGYAYTKLLRSEHRRCLDQVLPRNGRRPTYVNGDGYFDTLHVYQLAANALHFKVHRVRPLTLQEQLSSDEVVHIGKVSYYRRYKTRSEPRLRNLYILLLQADYVLLSEMAGQLPSRYDLLRREIRAEIEALGLVPEIAELKPAICREMVSRGASESAIRRILARPASPEDLRECSN